MRLAIHDVDPEVPIVNSVAMEQARADYAGLALAIAVIGIGSMLALWVRQRTREIGIRMALGASPADILRKLVCQGMVLVVCGLVAGLAGAVALTRLIKTMLFQVEPTDLATYVAVSAWLLAERVATTAETPNATILGIVRDSA